MTSSPPPTAFREEARKIIASGALGRSATYARLLEYLADCAARDVVPKEIEIAMAVFGRGPDFDPGQDATVRVYIHNLRQKIERYYAGRGPTDGPRLSLARGEYRLLSSGGGATDRGVTAAAAAAASASTGRRLRSIRVDVKRAVVALAFVAGVLLGAGWSVSRTDGGDTPAIAAAPVWRHVLEGDRPLLVVVGDYYIFGERDANGEVTRLVRRFDVNSSRALDELKMHAPELVERYVDLDLTYLPRAAAVALANVMSVLRAADRPLRVLPLSELTVTELKTSNVVYLGYVSGLGMLEDFVFAASGLEVGETYDELRAASGAVYTSEGGLRAGSGVNYRDFGLISTFAGPGGNQLLIIAGTRDAGLMHVAHALANERSLRVIEQARPDKGGSGPPAFEMLFEVLGYGRTNLDAKLVHAATLSYEEIWGGGLITARQ